MSDYVNRDFKITVRPTNAGEPGRWFWAVYQDGRTVDSRTCGTPDDAHAFAKRAADEEVKRQQHVLWKKKNTATYDFRVEPEAP